MDHPFLSSIMSRKRKKPMRPMDTVMPPIGSERGQTSRSKSVVWVHTLLQQWTYAILGDGCEPTMPMARKLMALATPTIVANILWFVQQATAQSFVGRRCGGEALAQFAVGVSIYNVCGLSLGIGLAAALDTLASQAYGRSPRNPELGELLQRSVLIDIVMSLPLMVAFQYVDPLLQFVYSDELAVGASSVLHASALYLPVNIINNSIIKTVQGQNLPEIQFIGNCVGALVCLIASHLLIEDSLVQGVYALTIACVAQFVTLVVLCWWHPRCALRYSQWPLHPQLFDLDAMRLYLEVGLPSMLSLCAEWWAFELLIVLAARVSDLEVTILSVCLSVTGMSFSVALGVSAAGSVCIGNALGENKPNEAKAYFVLTMLLDQAVTCCTVSTILIGRRFIAALYSNDVVVVDAFDHVAVIVAVFHWGDSTQYTLQGVFRGAGKQSPAAKAVLLSLWLVGVPMCWYLGDYHKYGSGGILMGLICGFCVEVPLLLRDLAGWDWVALGEYAAKSLDEVEHQAHHNDDGGAEHHAASELHDVGPASYSVLSIGDGTDTFDVDEKTNLTASTA